MDAILTSAKGQFALFYLNDTFNFSKTLEKHIDYVMQVLTLPPRAGVKLQSKKCFFLTDTIEYLGYVIPLTRLEIAAHTADAIQN